jgi:hypothetical protein
VEQVSADRIVAVTGGWRKPLFGFGQCDQKNITTFLPHELHAFAPRWNLNPRMFIEATTLSDFRRRHINESSRRL